MIRPTIEVEDKTELAAVEQALAMVANSSTWPMPHPMATSWLSSSRPPSSVVAASRASGSRTCWAPRPPTWRKKGRGWTCPCGGVRRHHGQAQRRLVTAAGDVTLTRVYFTCRRCGQHSHALDERLGVHGLISPHAQRWLCLVGAEHAFERAAQLVRELAGVVVCDNTVRHADPARLEQIIANQLANAAKYTDEGIHRGASRLRGRRCPHSYPR